MYRCKNYSFLAPANQNQNQNLEVEMIQFTTAQPMFEYEFNYRRDLFFQLTEVYCQTTNDDELHICGCGNSIWGIIAENVFVSEWSSDHEKVASEAQPEPVRVYEALSLRCPVTQLLPWLQLERSWEGIIPHTM